MSEGQTSELFAVICTWAVEKKGAANTTDTPGLWSADTCEANGLGPLHVKINPHPETIDCVPPGYAMVSADKDAFLPVALVNMTGGEVMYSPKEGEDEAGLIAHFTAQPD